MKVVRAPHAGFCWGVRRAVETASQIAAAAGGGKVYTDGPLIHNNHELARLAPLGIVETKDPLSLAKGSRLLIRAHGIPPARRASFSERELCIFDATCPNVAHVQRLCAEAATRGYVLILGDRGHAEVIGLLGFAAGRGIVVGSAEELKALDLSGENAITLVSQTTQSQELFEIVAAELLKMRPDAKVVNTICRATRDRQSDLAILADSCDAIVVAGSPASANTQRLAQLASELRPTFIVDSADELRCEDFAHFYCVGLTAGASTPDSVIIEIENKISGF